MSHQTGIKCNQGLRDFIAKAKNGNIRLIKIIINDNEELALDCYKEVKHDWKTDYNEFILKVIDSKMPSYLFYRFDEQRSNGYTWLFITWSPDFASIKQKMLYAATKSTLKLEFGASQVKDELFGTVKDDVSYDGYIKHLNAQLAPKPLTNREEELIHLKQSENDARISVESKHKTLQGVMFPIDENAYDRLIEFDKGDINYLQLYIDTNNEEILLGCSKVNLKPNELYKETPNENGRFHLYRFIHIYNGENYKNVIFIYSMPGFSAPIKERMLYSSCKNELLNYLKSNYSFEICKTIETSDIKEIDDDYLFDELHPKQQSSASKFDKPKGPNTRGPRRITKADQ